MPTMENFDPSILFAMMKGEPGTRKSTCALSFPTPQYWASFDKKMGALIIPMRKWGISPADISYDDYFEWSPFMQKLEQFRVKCPYKSLMIDSISSAGDVINIQTLKFKRFSKDRGEGTQKSIAGIAVNSVEDYNAETSAFAEMMSNLLDIHKAHKVNIVIMAHVLQTEYKDLSGETHMSRTIVTGAKKASVKIPSYCNETYHLNIKKAIDLSQGGSYSLLTQHTGDDFARTALPLPKEVEFKDNPLYSTYLVPAIEKLTKGEK